MKEARAPYLSAIQGGRTAPLGPFESGNRFGVSGAAGNVWLIAPPEVGESLARREVLNLLAALSLEVNASTQEIEAAKDALREGPDTGAKWPNERLDERAAARRARR